MEITTENFNDQIKSSSILLIDCYTDWCSPCKILKPIMEKITKENEDIQVGFLNIEDNHELGSELNISSVPTVLVIKDGEIVDRVSGVRSEEYYIKLARN